MIYNIYLEQEVKPGEDGCILLSVQRDLTVG